MKAHSESPCSDPRGRPQRVLALRGFSLVEIVGVLAVIAVVAAAVTPAILKRIRLAMEEKEAKDLIVIADAYKSSVLRNKIIPDHTTWSRAVADELERPLNHVELSASQRQRAFLIDPDLAVGTTNGKLPYTQTGAGSVKPAQLRLLVLSSLGSPLPVVSGTPSSNVFNAIWNTPPGGVPAGWTSGAKGEDLKVQRIELGPLFVRLILNYLDPDRTAMYSIDGNTPANVPTTPGGVTAYYLQGSVLGLRDATGQLLAREIIQKDNSFAYERGIWRGLLLEGKLRGGKRLAQAIDLFLSRPRPRGASPSQGPKFGATEQAVADLFYYYMLHFAEWSRVGFPDNGANSQQQVPAFQALSDAQAHLETGTFNLIDR